MYCTHSRAYIGLDAVYCPDCQQTFDFGSKTYEQILKRDRDKELPEYKESGVVDETKSFKEFAIGNGKSEHSLHSHQFIPVWQSDCTVVSWCKCGEKRECNIQELRESLQSCIGLKAEYLREKDLCSSKARQQEFARAVAVKDRQIAWVERQIESSSLLNSGDSFVSTLCCLALDEIRRDGGTQSRTAVDLKHVGLLEEQIEEGKELEPVTVFYDGSSYWLADGFHRFAAHQNQGKEAIACVIHSGSRRDAVLYSVGANSDHKPALPRSREDKRRVVLTLLQDPEWGKWSDREIAQHCKVDHKTVGKIRGSLTGEFPSEKERTYKTKHGTQAKMNTANIGRFASVPQENLIDSNRCTEHGDHLLNPKQSGKITQLPILDSATVELATVELDAGKQDLEHSAAPNLKFNEGGLVEVRALGNNKINGRRGRIAAVHEHTIEVWLRDVDTMIMQKHTLKHQQVEILLLKQEPQLKQVCARLSKLRSCSLDPFEVEIVNLLERTFVLTPTEMKYLKILEDSHENEL